jgi:tRNA A37 threonylcarbamoyladenosine dehydratase
MYERTERLLGSEAVEKIKNSRVAVFGAGGVGSAAIEALARAGIGGLALFNQAIIAQANINRQIIALHSTVGKPKTEVARERVLDINPHCDVNAFRVFVNAENVNDYDFNKYDYVIDAVDNVTAKLAIAEACKAADTPIVASMGTGDKLDPFRFRIGDIADTTVCPLARVMRRELKKRGIAELTVLWSDEPPVRNAAAAERGSPPGSVSFVPPVAGMMIAGYVIKQLICS